VHPNAELLRRFYEAFQRRDGEAMAGAYAPAARFSDPVFPALSGSEVGAMWRMLTSRARDLTVTLGELEADAGAGRARWEATYLFSATGRRVHNAVEGRFRFAGGRIAEHVDDFDFWRWSRQALGPAGLLLGWSPLLRRRVQAQARAGLEAFLRRSR
jgi:ketosteroid isomerase-like protein